MANREEMHVTESNLTMAPDVMYYNMSLTTGDMELVRLQVDCEVEGANALFEATSEVKIAGPRDLLDESQSEAQVLPLLVSDCVNMPYIKQVWALTTVQCWLLSFVLTPHSIKWMMIVCVRRLR